MKALDWRILIFAGFTDILVGAGLAFGGLTDFFGPGLEFLAVVGGVMALVGAGFVVIGRRKYSQVEDRRGDLN